MLTARWRSTGEMVPRPKVKVGPPAKPLLVSDTHVYTGSEEGHVLAFASPSGE